MRLGRLLPRTTLAVLATTVAAVAMPTTAESPSPDPRAGPTDSVVGRGRIEPRDGLVVLAGPVGGGTLARLVVVAGSRVTEGAVVAELQDRAVRAAAVAAAERDLDVARAELDRVLTPAKPSEIAMERARLVLEELMLEEARSDAERAGHLFRRGQLAAAAHEKIARALVRAESAKLHAEARLAALTEVRPVDAAAARATVTLKAARLAEARAALAQTIVRSPCTCTVIDVGTRPGEAIGAAGIVRLADLDRLVVTAEIDERQMLAVRLGQRARVTAPALAAPIEARVTRIGTIAAVNLESDTDLLRSVDARVAEVELTADPPARLPHLIGLDLDVVIQTGERVAGR